MSASAQDHQLTADAASPRFRADVEGLRGVAVTLVVLFHIGLDSFAGGYVGVDVFFVISGYLISAQLIREIEANGRVQLFDFWARRFRRLMPMLFLTLVATLGAGLFVYSPLFWQQLANEGVASALYVSNVHFAQRSWFYFQSGTSPLLHTWSLSVEEQFYLAWPVIVAVAGVAALRLRRSVRRMTGAVIMAAVVCSFVIALALVRRGSPWAFFSGPSRAWEFGLGALSYLAVDRVARIGWWVRQAALGLGLTAIVAASLWFDQYTDMPGVATLLPVGGTMLVLVADAGSTRGVGRVLSTSGVRALGRVSYGWYLFHWPAIVLVAAAMLRSSVLAAAFAAVGSLVLAAIATRAVEVPVRQSVRLRRPSVVLIATGLAVLSIIGGGLLIEAGARQRLSESYLADLLDARNQRIETGSDDCVEQTLVGGDAICVYGDPSSSTTVMLWGDSHAAQWAPAFEAAARELGVRLVVRTRGGCPALAVFVARSGDDRVSYECQAFRDAARRVMVELRPALVVVANADFTRRLLSEPEGRFLDRSEAMGAWSSAAQELAEQVAASGSMLAMIEDNPSQEREPIECLARGLSVAECSISSARALLQIETKAAAEREAFESVAAVQVFRTAPLICDEVRCAVQIDDVVVYSDRDHLSLAFVKLHTPELVEFVADALGGSAAA